MSLIASLAVAALSKESHVRAGDAMIGGGVLMQSSTDCWVPIADGHSVSSMPSPSSSVSLPPPFLPAAKQMPGAKRVRVHEEFGSSTDPAKSEQLGV